MVQPEILDSFKDKGCLVTGATGLIGRQIVNILHRSGAYVTGVSLDSILVPGLDELIFGDLTDFPFCKSAVRGNDFVFHLAGIKGSPSVTKEKPASFFVPILMMNTNVLEACRLNNVQRVVYASSIGAYPCDTEHFSEHRDNWNNPPMDYFPGWAKRMGELQTHAYQAQYGLNNFAVVRPGNVYGPGDNFDPNNAMIIPSLMAKIRRGDKIQLQTDGGEIRDFAYSRDVAEGFILALYHGTTARGFVNLGSGNGYSIRTLVETLQEITPFECSYSDSPAAYHSRIMDITLARKELGFNPTTSLKEGLQKTWDWFVQNSDEHLSKKNYFVETTNAN